jgi:uncharacterized protein (TIGR03435 family)
MMMESNAKGDMIIEVRGSTTAQFAQRLAGRLDRTVIDETDVNGKVNFHLEFTNGAYVGGQAVPPGSGGDVDSAANPANQTTLSETGPNLFAALQEQIGLKLAPDRGPIGFLIIDHVEKPASN